MVGPGLAALRQRLTRPGDRPAVTRRTFLTLAACAALAAVFSLCAGAAPSLLLRCVYAGGAAVAAGVLAAGVRARHVRDALFYPAAGYFLFAFTVFDLHAAAAGGARGWVLLLVPDLLWASGAPGWCSGGALAYICVWSVVLQAEVTYRYGLLDGEAVYPMARRREHVDCAAPPCADADVLSFFNGVAPPLAVLLTYHLARALVRHDDAEAGALPFKSPSLTWASPPPGAVVSPDSARPQGAPPGAPLIAMCVTVKAFRLRLPPPDSEEFVARHQALADKIAAAAERCGGAVDDVDGGAVVVSFAGGNHTVRALNLLRTMTSAEGDGDAALSGATATGLGYVGALGARHRVLGEARHTAGQLAECGALLGRKWLCNKVFYEDVRHLQPCRRLLHRVSVHCDDGGPRRKPAYEVFTQPAALPTWLPFLLNAAHAGPSPFESPTSHPSAVLSVGSAPACPGAGDAAAWDVYNAAAEAWHARGGDAAAAALDGAPPELVAAFHAAVEAARDVFLDARVGGAVPEAGGGERVWTSDVDYDLLSHSGSAASPLGMSVRSVRSGRSSPAQASVVERDPNATAEARADAWLEEAAESQLRIDALRHEGKALRECIKRSKDGLAKDAPVAARVPLWTQEQALLTCEEQLVQHDAERRQQLRQALVVCKTSTPALTALLTDCLARHRAAIRGRDPGLGRALLSEALGLIERLPLCRARQHAQEYFLGVRTLRLPLAAAARVSVAQYVLSEKRLVPQPLEGGWLDGAALEATREVVLQLPVGSYVATIAADGRAPVVYPFDLAYGEDWAGAIPARPLPLPTAAECGPGARYVPEGWTVIGGDPEAPNGLPDEQKLWLDGFVIGETAVTNAQYLEFLNDVLAAHGEAEASLWVPREKSTSETELGNATCVLENGKYATAAPGQDDLPVVNVTWFETLAYTHWLSEKTGQPWRLPSELEWEKAARGVDGRCFPWGDQFDPMFCVMMDSHAGKLALQSARHPRDLSVYGVCGMAGNVREWCLDRFCADRYAMDDGMWVMPTYEDLISEEFRACRGGSYGNAAQRTRSADRDWWFPLHSYFARGFRVARSWPPTPASAALQADIERAYEHARAGAQARHAVAADCLKAKIEAATEGLKKQAAELQELDRQKTTFFQSVSHELRTPLTLILVPLEAEIAKRTPKSTENLAVAARNARRLLRLVNQLLDFQKLDAGRAQLQPVPTELGAFLRVCGEDFQNTCESTGKSFSLDTAEAAVWVAADRGALEKIVFNFLSNALKYTPHGGAISLALTATAEAARISVADTGPGISDAGRAKLFQVFTQLDEATARGYEGTGLGLALVKSLAEEMGGAVGCDSAVGAGATFWARLPVCAAPTAPAGLADAGGDFKVKDWLITTEAHQPQTVDLAGTHAALALGAAGDDGAADAAAATADPAAQLPMDREVVLVVDDLQDMRQLIRGALEDAGYHVLTAANGRAGLAAARKVRPDLIVSDWMMPIMNGVEFLQHVKQRDKALHTIPFVLLTAKSDEESKLLGTAEGADAYLGKPFNAAELTCVVRNLLALKAKEREVVQLNHMITEKVLKRYLPRDLVDRIVSGDLSMDKPAEVRRVTVLFSDIVGFTAASEALGAGPIAAFLNQYLTAMTEVIFRHGGTIDKFIGDAIMVLFGAPVDLPAEEQARQAAACALAMQDRLRLLAADASAALDTPSDFTSRIGVHHGDAVVGNFGSAQRVDYTAIGPAVNMASRVEGVCEPGRVFITRDVGALLPRAAYEEAGAFDLKGIGVRSLCRLTDPTPVL